MEHKETLSLTTVLSVLERVVDRDSEVFSTGRLRFELINFVGLHKDEATGIACSLLISLRLLIEWNDSRTTGLDGVVADIVFLSLSS